MPSHPAVTSTGNLSLKDMPEVLKGIGTQFGTPRQAEGNSTARVGRGNKKAATPSQMTLNTPIPGMPSAGVPEWGDPTSLYGTIQ